MNRGLVWLLRIFLAVIFVLVGGLAGFVVGVNQGTIVTDLSELKNIDRDRPEAVDFSPFWKAWAIINEKYLAVSTSTEAAKTEDKIWGAIDGLVKSLGDPYSVFLPPDDNELFQEEIRGDFGGVGMEIGVRNEWLTVIAPLPNTPAKRAGILAGDQIIQIDDAVVVDTNVEKAIKLIRGPSGSQVRLTIKRENESRPLQFVLIREQIQVPTIDRQIVAGDVFLIRLYNFGATADQLFRQAIAEFKSRGLHKLVIDLRGNPGGYLDVAVDIASWFLPEGTVVAIEDHGDDIPSRFYKSRGYYNFGPNLQLIVLVDGGSASASEILAGALSEHRVATLVGETTFGKGSVQELIGVTDDTALKITVARWLTPKGVSIAPDGLKPDVTVTLATSTAGLSKLDISSDTQLQAALKILESNSRP